MSTATLTEAQAARLLATWTPTASTLDQEIEKLLKATQPPPPSPEVTWYADLSSGTIAYPYKSFVGNHVSVVTDPKGSGRNVLRYAIDDSDRPYVGASNPRGDIETPSLFGPGADYFITDSLLLPPNFPLVNHGWWQVGEFYGPPHGGSPPIGFYIWGGSGTNRLILQRQGQAPLWTGPPLDLNWHRITSHVHFATDSTAFVDLYYDGQHIAGPFKYPNLVPGVNWDGKTPNIYNLNSYRAAGAFPGTVTLYHGPTTIAQTLAGALSKPLP